MDFSKAMRGEFKRFLSKRDTLQDSGCRKQIGKSRHILVEKLKLGVCILNVP